MASSPWAELASWLLLPALVVALSAGWAVAIGNDDDDRGDPERDDERPGDVEVASPAGSGRVSAGSETALPGHRKAWPFTAVARTGSQLVAATSR